MFPKDSWQARTLVLVASAVTTLGGAEEMSCVRKPWRVKEKPRKSASRGSRGLGWASVTFGKDLTLATSLGATSLRDKVGLSECTLPSSFLLSGIALFPYFPECFVQFCILFFFCTQAFIFWHGYKAEENKYETRMWFDNTVVTVPVMLGHFPRQSGSLGCFSLPQLSATLRTRCQLIAESSNTIHTQIKRHAQGEKIVTGSRM